MLEIAFLSISTVLGVCAIVGFINCLFDRPSRRVPDEQLLSRQKGRQITRARSKKSKSRSRIKRMAA